MMCCKTKSVKYYPVIPLTKQKVIFFITHPLTPSLTLEKGNCGEVIPLYNFREGERGGELR